MLRRGAHRELVHVRLADDDSARGVQPLHDVRVIWGDESLQDPAARRRLTATRHDEVLEGHRDAEQWGQGLHRPAPLAARFGQAGVGGEGGPPGPLSVHGQPGVQGVVLLGDESKVGLQQLQAGDIAVTQEYGHLVCVEAGQRPTMRWDRIDRHR